VNLNAYHCKEISLFALEKNQFDMAVFWMEEAIRKVSSGQDTSESVSSLKVHMEEIAHKVSFMQIKKIL